ncbi:MAG: serine/threonine protein kinase [Bryobacterales bacterium]|nr:serine/threonine protein kinase [Bryobacterales bacterium]
MNPADWARIDELFHEAVALPAGEREAFLNQACDDPSIRAEVMLLLRHDSQEEAGFDQAVAAAAVAMVKEKRSWVIGRRIGPYRVTGMIGEGGMGAVYGAVRDDDSYQKEVAIKLVRHGLETGRVVERFRAERQILARLEHPYIARLLDGGATDEGFPYLVMERIHGTPVTLYANQAELGLEGRLRLFLKVCEAVQYAHASLIIHRDIKPANILITQEGTPRLLDFGLARVLAEDSHDPQTTGAFLMTPAYASPEQVQGNAVTTATDVYSLGAVLYELLTGRPPHDVKGVTALEAAKAICGGEVKLPSRAANNPLVRERELEGDIDNILLMALRQDTARRYRSVEQFAADLQRYLDGLPVVARADTVRYRTAKFVTRNRWPMVAATVAFVALAFGIVTSQISARRERRRFDQVRQLVNRVLFEVHDAVKPLAGSLPARELILRNALEYLNSLSVEAAGDPDLAHELAGAYRKLGELQGTPTGPSRGDGHGARASLARGIELERQATAKQPKQLAFRLGLAEMLMEQMRIEAHASEFGAAKASAREAIAVLEQTLALHPSDAAVKELLAQSYLFLGVDILARINELAPAAELLRKSIPMFEQVAAAAPGPEHQNKLAGAYGSLGRLLALLRDTEGSRKAYARSVELRERLVKEHPDNAEYGRGLLVNYGGLSDRIAEPCSEERVAGASAARPVYEKMIGLARKLAVDEKDRTSQADLAQTLLRMGCLEQNEGNTAAASALFTEALARTKPFASPETATTGVLLLRLNLLGRYGSALVEGKRLDEAMAQYQAGLEILRVVERRAPGLPDTWGRSLSMQGRMALLLAAKRDIAGLEALAGKVRREVASPPAMKLTMSQMPLPAIAALRFGQAYEQLREAKQACAWWRSSEDWWRKMEGAGGVPGGYQGLRQQAAEQVRGCVPPSP